MGIAAQGAVFASQQSSSTQTSIGGGQGGGISINISSGGANQQSNSFNNGGGSNNQSQSVGNGAGAGFSSSGTRPTPALGNAGNPGANVNGSPNAPSQAIGHQLPDAQPASQLSKKECLGLVAGSIDLGEGTAITGCVLLTGPDAPACIEGVVAIFEPVWVAGVAGCLKQ
jgi:hypothetical protein